MIGINLLSLAERGARGRTSEADRRQRCAAACAFPKSPVMRMWVEALPLELGLGLIFEGEVEFVRLTGLGAGAHQGFGGLREECARGGQSLAGQTRGKALGYANRDY